MMYVMRNKRIRGNSLKSTDSIKGKQVKENTNISVKVHFDSITDEEVLEFSDSSPD